MPRDMPAPGASLPESLGGERDPVAIHPQWSLTEPSWLQYLLALLERVDHEHRAVGHQSRNKTFWTHQCHHRTAHILVGHCLNPAVGTQKAHYFNLLAARIYPRTFSPSAFVFRRGTP